MDDQWSWTKIDLASDQAVYPCRITEGAGETSAIMPLTTQGVMVDDSGQAGAIEIEITPEMIDVGIEVLGEHLLGEDLRYLSQKIFMAMLGQAEMLPKVIVPYN